MSVSLANFITAAQVADSVTDLVLTSSGESKYIGQLTFTNTSASAVEVTVHKILSEDAETTGSGGNWLIKKTIQPGRVWNALSDIGNIVLAELQTLSATASTASVVNAECAGTTET